MSRVVAPFAPDQVRSLNAYQRSWAFHPFTCGSSAHVTRQRNLVAFKEGWHCSDEACNYSQNWAWEFMANWTWTNMSTKDWRPPVSGYSRMSRHVVVESWIVPEGNHASLIAALQEARQDYARSNGVKPEAISDDSLTFRIAGTGDAVIISYERDVNDPPF